MTSANVSQIPFGFMENTNAKSAAKSDGKSQDFMQMVANSLQSNDQKQDMTSAFVSAPNSDSKVNTSNQAFNQSDFSARTIPNNETTSQQMSTKDVDETIEKVDQFISEVKQVLSEEMDVSDEEIKEAMEILGLDMIDLTLPENVTKLLGVLEGDENVSLILNDTVSNVLNEIQPLISNLFEDMDVTGTSELKNLLMENDLVVTYEGLEKAPIDLGPNGEVIGVKLSPDEMISSQVLNTDPLIQDESNQTPLTPTENETPVEVKAPLVSEETKVKAELENFDFEEVQEMEVEKKVVDAPSTQQNSEGFYQNQNGKKNGFAFETNVVNNTSVQYSTNVTQDSTISFANVVEESTTSYTSIDVEDIMNQIVTQTRTQVSDTLTSMELELHPASLGKMYLQVTENNGSITAKLYTENQDVKAAMETQMAILKETWNQQGMKVNAIEISVGTREFEEQLDAQANATFENGSSSFNGSSEEEPAKRNRNLSLTGLEELPEDMTEEERLTVNMMKDLGNSINFTA